MYAFDALYVISIPFENIQPDDTAGVDTIESIRGPRDVFVFAVAFPAQELPLLSNKSRLVEYPEPPFSNEMIKLGRVE
jgi:hypothetical protein